MSLTIIVILSRGLEAKSPSKGVPLLVTGEEYYPVFHLRL